MEKLIDKIINNMTLEEKIGQLIFIMPETLAKRHIPSNRYLRYLMFEFFPKINTINKRQIKTLKKYHVGGVLFFQRHIETREKLTKYIEDLNKNSKYPLFIACDEEGGYVRRLGRVKALNFPSIPHMSEVGETKDPNKAFEIGEILGKEMTKLGLNVNFAPIADVRSSSVNKNNYNLSAKRYFSDDPILVSDMVEAIVKGMQENNLSATLKHFPGHGSALGDTHIRTSISQVDLETLRNRELLPFKAGIKAGADFVMVGHQSLPNVLKTKLPCCMSKFIVTDILRGELNYDGIVICDSLKMKAILKHYKIKDVITHCLNAGVDIIMLPPKFKKTIKIIKHQVKNNIISEETINNSVRRILRVKIKQGLIIE